MTHARAHLIVGGTRGLGSAVLAHSTNCERITHTVSRERIGKSLTAHASHTSCDLENSGDLDNLKSELGSLAKELELITFCQRFRPPTALPDRDVAAGTLAVETIATSEIIRAVAEHKGDNRISVVICSSLNAGLVNPNLSLWYHVAKAANRQLVRYFSASLAEHDIGVSAIEFGSFRKSGVKLDHGTAELLGRLGGKSASGNVPTDAELAQVIDLVHQSQLRGLMGQVYSYDGGTSQFAPEYLLDGR